jgi:hypothetical protein
MKKLMIIAVAAAGAVAAAVIGFMLFSSIPTQDYALSVDALADKQSLFTNARVTITNTGKLPLTNVFVDYGNNKHDLIGQINPGDKMLLSPPDGSQLGNVTVTADHGIRVVQPYREPIKLPGMMGS